MKNLKAMILAISITPWFIKTSWGYIVNNSVKSKAKFVVGLIPAWVRFTVLSYKDIKGA